MLNLFVCMKGSFMQLVQYLLATGHPSESALFLNGNCLILQDTSNARSLSFRGKLGK